MTTNQEPCWRCNWQFLANCPACADRARIRALAQDVAEMEQELEALADMIASLRASNAKLLAENNGLHAAIMTFDEYKHSQAMAKKLKLP